MNTKRKLHKKREALKMQKTRWKLPARWHAHDEEMKKMLKGIDHDRFEALAG